MKGHVSDLLARRSELTPQEEAHVQSHLAGCRQCRNTATIYAGQHDLLKALPLVMPPPALRAGVLEYTQLPRPRVWRTPWLPLLGAAVAAVLIVAALATLRGGNSGRHTAITVPTRPATVTFGPAATPPPRPAKAAVKKTASHPVPKKQRPRPGPKKTPRQSRPPSVPPPAPPTAVAAQLPVQTATPLPAPPVVVAANAPPTSAPIPRPTPRASLSHPAHVHAPVAAPTGAPLAVAPAPTPAPFAGTHPHPSPTPVTIAIATIFPIPRPTRVAFAPIAPTPTPTPTRTVTPTPAAITATP